MKEDGISLGVMTNKFQEGAVLIIEEDLPGLFACVYGTSEDVPRKPVTDGILRVVGVLGVELGGCS